MMCVYRADLAHLVERDLAKVEVAGSSPVIRLNIKKRRSGLTEATFSFSSYTGFSASTATKDGMFFS